MTNGKILLVEDDYALAMGTEYTLKTENYDVVRVADLAAAKKKSCSRILIWCCSTLCCRMEMDMTFAGGFGNRAIMFR